MCRNEKHCISLLGKPIQRIYFNFYKNRRFVILENSCSRMCLVIMKSAVIFPVFQNASHHKPVIFVRTN